MTKETSALDLKNDRLSDHSVVHSSLKIKELRSRLPEYEGDDLITAQNLILHYTNTIRQALNLEPLKPKLSESDLEMILEVDGWNSQGKLISDLLQSLEKSDPGERASLKQRFTDKIELHNFQTEHQSQIDKKLEALTDRFRKFVSNKSSRPEKIEYHKGNPVVSDTWKIWIEALEKLQTDLGKSVDEFKSLERNGLEIPDYAKDLIQWFHHTKNLILAERGEI